MILRNLFLAVTKRFGELQSVSDTFWRESTYTYLASNEYYEKRQSTLADALSRMPHFRRAVDIGCGDGRFTLEIAKRAEVTVGYDISPALIQQARSSAAAIAGINARFEIASIENIDASLQADLVSCMGVLSCMVDHVRYSQAIGIICGLVKPGGLLMLIDTVAMNKSFTRTYRNGYVAHYRSEASYETAILETGMRLVDKKLISPMSASTVNNLYLFARDKVTG